jgi:septal ring factor EnvC (AmiA/AmiB activator)
MEWGFMVLSAACAVFLVQILLEYNRQSSELRPEVQRIEAEMKGEREERDRYLKTSEDLKAHIAQLDTELSQLEAKRAELERAIRSRQDEDGETPKRAVS